MAPKTQEALKEGSRYVFSTDGHNSKSIIDLNNNFKILNYLIFTVINMSIYLDG